jgi:transcriptional regulator with XRE-family HTH domain
MALIKSDTVYNEERGRYARVAMELGRQRRQLEAEGLTPDEIEAELEPLTLRVEELAEQLALYARLQRGDLTDLDGLSAGQRLIAARIARGFSQKQLAELLEVDQAQVSRDEGSEYRAATLEKFQRVAQALGMHLSVTPRTSPETAVVQMTRVELIPPAPVVPLDLHAMTGSLPTLDTQQVLAAAAATACR